MSLSRHRSIHKIYMEQPKLVVPPNWKLKPQGKDLHGREGDQAIISPLQDGAEPDSAPIASAENVVNVTESLPEHPSDE